MQSPQPWPLVKATRAPTTVTMSGHRQRTPADSGGSGPLCPLPLPGLLAPGLVILPYRCVCCPLLAVRSSARLPAAVGGCPSRVLPLGWGDSFGSPPWSGLSHVPL